MKGRLWEETFARSSHIGLLSRSDCVYRTKEKFALPVISGDVVAVLLEKPVIIRTVDISGPPPMKNAVQPVDTTPSP